MRCKAALIYSSRKGELMDSSDEKINEANDWRRRERQRRKNEMLRTNRAKRGIKVRVFMKDEVFRTTPLYMDGILKRFLANHRPPPDLLEDVAVEQERTGVNSRWIFTKRDAGFLGTIGQVWSDQVNDQSSMITINSMDSFLPLPTEAYGEKVYEKSIWLLQEFADYLRKILHGDATPAGSEERYPRLSIRETPGRRHFEDDIWAHNELRSHPEKQPEIYQSWLNRPGVRARDLKDPKRHFRKIIRADWVKTDPD